MTLRNAIPRAVLTALALTVVAAPARGETFFIREFGQTGSGTGQFRSPEGITTTLSGEVLVTDGLRNRVLRFDAAGAFLGEFGQSGSGVGQFKFPTGIVEMPTGELLVTDATRERVLRFDAAGTFLGEFGQSGSGTGEFSVPFSVAATPSGEVLVADRGRDRVLRFDAGGTFLGEFGQSGSGVGQFTNPRGVAALPTGEILVADESRFRVMRFGAGGTFLDEFGQSGSGAGQFGSLFGIAATPSGEVLVADAVRDRVLRFDAGGTFLGEFGQSGSGVGQFDTPIGVATAETGMTSVTDAGRDRVLQFFDVRDFVAGTLDFSADGLMGRDDAEVGAGRILGQDLVLENGMGLDVAGELTIFNGGTLERDGGTLEVENLTLDGGRFLWSGDQEVGDELNIGGGSSLAVDDSRRLQVGGDVTIDSISNPFGVTENGTLSVLGTSFETPGDVTVFGELRLLGANAAVRAETISVEPGGLLAGRGAIETRELLDIAGVLAMTAGPTDVFGDVDITGTVAVGGNGTLTFFDDVNHDGTRFELASGSTAVFFGELTGSGDFQGSGSVEIFGDLRPGASPGIMEFGGDLMLGASSSTSIELFGTDLIDRLFVLGDASLGGTLDVRALDGFTLSPGDSFLFLSIDGLRTGTFLNAAEGDVVLSHGGVDLQLTYFGGDGNDLVLFAAIPEPSTLVLVGLAVPVLVLGRRVLRRRA